MGIRHTPVAQTYMHAKQPHTRHKIIKFKEERKTLLRVLRFPPNSKLPKPDTIMGQNPASTEPCANSLESVSPRSWGGTPRVSKRKIEKVPPKSLSPVYTSCQSGQPVLLR